MRKPVVRSRANLKRVALKLTRFLLVLLAITAIVVPLWGFVYSLRSSLPNLDKYESNKVVIDPSGTFDQERTRPFDIETWVIFQSIEPAGGNINIDVSLIIDDRRLLSGIIDRKTRDSVFAKDGKGQMVLLPQYRNLNLNVVLPTRSFDDLATPVPLQRLSGPLEGSTPAFTVSARLGMNTSAYSRYPSDWYRIEPFFVAVQLPSELAWEALGRDGGDHTSIQTALRLLNGLQPRDKAIYVKRLQTVQVAGFSKQDPYHGVDVTFFSVLIERQLLPKAFVWVIAATPALLIPVMIIQLSRTRRISSTNLPTDRYVSLELAAAVLAILPLRQVLVPAEIQGLTTIDYLLGAQLAIFIALVVIQFTFSLSQQRIPPR